MTIRLSHLALGLLLAHPAFAQDVLVDFEDLPLGGATSTLVVQGGVTFTASNGLFINDLTPFDPNGTNWPGLAFKKSLSTVNGLVGAPYAPITILLDPPASRVSLGWWDPNFTGNQLEAYDSDGLLVDVDTPELFSPGGCCVDEVVVSSTVDEIATVIVRNGFSSDWYVIDMVAVTRAGSAWVDLGGGLAGAGMPALTGVGPLQPGTFYRIAFDDGLASTPSTLVVGFADVSASFKGGVLVPSPDLLLSLPTDSDGAWQIESLWPDFIPGGFSLWFQAWQPDAGGPAGLSATNALRADVP